MLEDAGAATDRRGGSANFLLRAQAVFDAYGLRPAYLLDHGTAGQDAACLALRNLRDAGACAIGAWWTASEAEPDAARAAERGQALTNGTGFAPSYAAAEAMPLRVGAHPASRMVALPVTSGAMLARSGHAARLAGATLLPNRHDAERQIALIRTLMVEALTEAGFEVDAAKCRGGGAAARSGRL